ncbi:ABC transporter transmembrane domain-containing protein [Globicatella sulfidifaciens]
MKLLNQMKHLFKGSSHLVLLTTIFAFVTAFDGVVYPYFLGRFTDTLTEKAYDKIWLVIVLWGLSLVLITVGQLLYGYFLGKTRQNVNISLKDSVFKQAYQAGNEKKPSSEFINTILQDVKQIETQYVNSALNLIYCLLQGIIAFLLVLYTDWKVGLVFVALGFIPSTVPKILEKWLKQGTEDWQKNNQVYTDALKDTLEARSLVKRYQAVPRIFERILVRLTAEEKGYFTMNFRQAVSRFGVSALYYVTTMIGLTYGVYQLIQGNLTVGQLITIYMAADRVTTPLVSIFTYYSWMAGTEPLITTILNPATKSIIPKSPKFGDDEKVLIDLKDVSVGYEKQPIMSNVNLKIEDGDRILIQGPSGVGKSTLVRAIMNEVEPLDGEIEYGQKMSNGLTNHFAVVEQTPFLFNETLRFNLTLGQKTDDAKLIRILQQVGLGHLATKSQLDAHYGSENRVLSGGEMKRLEVARALLYGKEILVVDESLSGLDDTAAEQLNQVIIDYPGTVIDIEHHLSEVIAKKYTKTLTLSKNI